MNPTIPRRTFFILVFLILAVVTFLGLCRATLKVTLIAWQDQYYCLYSFDEIIALWVVSLVSLALAIISGVAGFVLFIKTTKKQFIFGITIRRCDVFLTIPFILAIWYFTSFTLYYSINGAFTRLGGSTPYCYSDPYFKIYEPLAWYAFQHGWTWCGNRYAIKYLGDT